MIYQKLNSHDAEALIEWANENGIDHDIRNADRLMLGTAQYVELGLTQWPDE